MLKRWQIPAFLLSVICCLGTAIAQSSRPLTPAAAAAAKTLALETYVHQRVISILDSIESEGDYPAAYEKLGQAFDLVIARATDKQLELFRQVNFAQRLVGQLGTVPPEKRHELFHFLRAHDNLAHAITFLVPPGQNPGPAYELLERLRTQRGDQLESFANLAAALCVVHAKPFQRRLNENETHSPDPLELFDYYAANEGKMVFGIRNVPAELLAYVVDTTNSIGELQWALGKYPRDANIGRHFFDINYDYESYFNGKRKRLDVGPYTLPNILKLGGVCVDQAFFTVSIGKAIGVPTAYTVGADGEGGHAWVGFLQAQNNRGFWNFNSGRYEEFQGVRGMVRDPLTRKEIPDAYVSLTAELISTTAADRQISAALTAAAGRLITIEKSGMRFHADDLPPELADAPAPLRDANIASELDLLRLAVVHNAGNGQAWFTLRALADDGKLTLAQKKEWSNQLLKLCGQRYPDFALAVLAPMIQTVEDPKEQNGLWNAAFGIFQSRSDLAAAVRMYQADLWERQRQTVSAGECYTDVINRYVNAGPFALDALAGAEKLLRSTGKAERVPALYQQAWAKCQKPSPSAAAFFKQSNWYRVGSILADRLRETNQLAQAAAIQTQLDGAFAK